jgi:hypothetical protein
MRTISKARCRFEMLLIYQPPNAHVWILLCNAMAAVKKIYTHDKIHTSVSLHIKSGEICDGLTIDMGT